MIATVQIADLGPAGAVRSLFGRLRPADVSGLRSADVALFTPLAFKGPPPVRRAGLIAFWDDDASADRFMESHPVGRRFTGGLDARMTPLRAYGSWPGLPADVPDSRAVPHDGPVVVLTLARLRASQTIRFARTSRPAERAAAAHEGLIWGTAAARPPFLATVSIWRNSQAAAAYAYGRQESTHSDAIDAQQRKDFHRRSAFVRCAPTRLEGSLSGSNPVNTAAIDW